jgi:hypothetical protein
MSINASGKGSSNMEADMDAAENARMNGTTDIRTENSKDKRSYTGQFLNPIINMKKVNGKS